MLDSDLQYVILSPYKANTLTGTKIMDMQIEYISVKPVEEMTFAERLAYQLDNAQSTVTQCTVVINVKPVYDWNREASQKRFIR